MFYCTDDGGHITWQPVRRVTTGYQQLDKGRTRKITELLCEKHAKKVKEPKANA